ncbi:HNH endonuclease [Croceicoccus marinus]|uniref:HNH endonuclease n=1 Tax=Croceicoccus marinus TaxID=450378 RepID=UPI000AD93D63|nr:hypothetical protein [Croceicoccus marinus]
MRNLSRPQISASEIYDSASERFLDQSLRAAFQQSRMDFLAVANDYGIRGDTKTLHEMPVGNPVSQIVDATHLRNLYSQGLLRRRSRARLYYEQIRLSSPYNICPYCNHRTVGSVDHYLPKESYPLLAVCPENLIPACSDCNKIKSNKTFGSYLESPVHPYFDYVNEDPWLRCDLLSVGSDWVATFCIESDFIEPPIAAKLQSHFNDFGLGELYAVAASTELSRQSNLINQYASAGGQSAVRDYLQKLVISEEAFCLNHWRAALARSCVRTADFAASFV